MKTGKFENGQKSSGKRALSLVLALVLLIGGVVGGTLAWLTASTNDVTNTFTSSDINITLDESDDLDLKMIPGHTITKDPVVTVLGGSEAAWLFVKVEESANFGQFMTYAMADGWTKLETGVYYRQVAANAADQPFHVIAEDTVTVKTDVTKAMMNGLTDATRPTLKFKAYAVQYWKDNTTPFTEAEAWAIAKP